MKLDRFLLFLQNVPGIGDATIRKLILGGAFKEFSPETLEDALSFIKSNAASFSKRFDAGSLKVEGVQEANGKKNAIESDCKKYGIKYISYFSDLYPERFKRMGERKPRDFPVTLFYKGDIGLLNAEKTCGIIGTRKPSEKGTKASYDLSKAMTDKGYVVISGLAEGCDAAAHRGCLDAGGKTVAIVGTGLDTVYPKLNEGLLDEILQKGGLVISEYPAGFKAVPYSFVQRDRLQASSSDVLIAVQTSINGGTMHAAKACVDKYGNKLCVVDPSLVSDGETSGNVYLIREYFAKKIGSLADLELNEN